MRGNDLRAGDSWEEFHLVSFTATIFCHLAYQLFPIAHIPAQTHHVLQDDIIEAPSLKSYHKYLPVYFLHPSLIILSMHMFIYCLSVSFSPK